MRESPKRPIIPKKRKPPFQGNESDGHHDQGVGLQTKADPGPTTQSSLDGVCIMDHPAMPNFQMVIIPKTASGIRALSAKGKERGPLCLNEFILLSGSGAKLHGESNPTFTTGPEGCVNTDLMIKFKPMVTDCQSAEQSRQCDIKVRKSPNRPIIPKKRKPHFQNESDVHSDKGAGLRNKADPAPTTQSFPDGICIMNHPTMPDTQVAVIPKTADLKSVISALSAKGKEQGPRGPNEFILSGSGTKVDRADTRCRDFGPSSHKSNSTLTAGHEACVNSDFMTNLKPLETDCQSSEQFSHCDIKIRESPKRPIIPKKRKPPFQRNESDQGVGPQTKADPAPTTQSFVDGICIINHPTKPDTQVVVIPKTGDLKSVISVLSAKGKGRGSQGPNKFILLSGSGTQVDGADTLCQNFGSSSHNKSSNPAFNAGREGCVNSDFMVDFNPTVTNCQPPEQASHCDIKMRESPRRPIILKRRKLPFQRNGSDDHSNQGVAPQTKAVPAPTTQSFPDGICIMNHPTMPDTQVVVIPKTADLKSVISALSAKGKERGPQGPNKFILLSGSGTQVDGTDTLCQNFGPSSHKSNPTLTTGPEGCANSDFMMDFKPLVTTKRLKKEGDCSMLDDSLTNIQWLGRMNTDDADSKPETTGSSKENIGGCEQLQQPRNAETGVGTAKEPLSERPPYSYMALIQFAINSNKNRRMTLKEIYNWIEDNFPYFRNVAKPGWKNSIRHNLSLHDMFVRESKPDSKISYWTIRPEANRCLTLDQVYKPLVDPGAPQYPQTLQVFYQHQQKQVVPEPKKLTPASSTERKMKPLLPRTNSYLVPIQLPLAPSLLLPSPAPMPQLNLQQKSMASLSKSGKKVRIAPKVLQKDPKSEAMLTPVSAELKEEPDCSEAPCPSNKRKESSSSRRKQRLVLPHSEEPVLLMPDSTFFDSGLACDISAFQDIRETESEVKPKAESPGQGYAFKTPIKGSHPASSTPSKPPAALEPWKVTPLGKGSRTVLDFSPIRTPSGLMHTPQRHEQTTFSFNSTPFKELPLFNSPRELLTIRPSPLRVPPSCSRELQVGISSSSPGLNRSLTEGLVLDTMNDSLSKILVDISFSGLEDDDLGMANLSWSQLIPELK